MNKEKVLFYLNRLRNSVPEAPEHEKMAEAGLTYAERQKLVSEDELNSEMRTAIETATRAVELLEPSDQLFHDEG